MGEEIMKFKKTLLVFCLIICVLFCVSSVAAGDVNYEAIASENQNVIENQDPVAASEATTEVDNEKIESDVISSSNEEILNTKDNGTFTTLQKKIDDASEGSTITLENDYVYDEGFDTKGIQITKSIIINGNGHTLDGLKMSRIFEVKSKEIVFNDIRFINGNSSNDGAAISSTAICQELTITNCIFNNNEASDYGGAIYAYGTLNIVNSTFISNRAKDYGAIRGLELYIKDSKFIDNYAENYGGAIYTGSISIISNCIFKNNEASRYGGGAINDGSELLNFINSTFISNRAYKGGAIFKGGFVDEEGDYLYVKDSEFIDNHAKGDGGAILINCYDKTTVSVYDIGGNVASSKIVVTYRNCSIENSVFTNNSAGYSSGGAICGWIYNSSGIPNGVKAINCNFTNNVAGHGTDFAGGMVINCIFTEISRSHDQSLEDAEEVNCTFNTKIDISVNNDVAKYYGDSQNFLITVYEDYEPIEDAVVKIIINNEEYSKTTDSNGQISLDLNWDVGTYDVVCEYKGFKVTSNVTVKSTITTNDAAGVYLNSKVTSTFLNVDGKALTSKQVIFKINGKEYAATTNSNGVATANIPLGVGTYTVVAVNPVNNEQKMFKLTISKADSKIVLTSIQSNGVTTLTATLTPTTASGNVVFNVNGENRNVQINNGKATLALKDLEAGNYTVAVIYNGDTNLKASTSNTVTFSVAEAYPVLTAKAVTKTYGTSTKLVVNLADNKGNAIANADVSVVIGSATTHIKTDSSGKATMSINKAPGTYTATITYLDAKTTAKITVKKATPKITAKSKTFKKSVKTKKYTVTLKTNLNKPMKITLVTLNVNKKIYKVKTNAKGQATFKINNLNKKGTFTAVVKFAGNKYYNAKTVKPKITVK